MYRLFGLAAAAAAACAGIPAAIVARESDDRMMLVVATAMVFYGMVLMPLSVARTAASAPFWLHGALAGASIGFLGLLAMTLSARHAGLAAGWRGMLGGLVITVVAALATEGFRDISSVLINSNWLSGIVLVGFWVIAVLFVVRGVRAGDSITWRIGLGVGVMAIAHLLRAAGDGRVVAPDVQFFALRLFGLLVLLGFLASYAKRVVAEQRQKRTEEYQRLRAAALAAERAAERSRERDHEIRNVVLGLSGAAHLLSAGQPVLGFDLSAAVTAELNRLSSLLERPADPEANRCTPVPDLLTRLVMLRRATGADIELEAPESLRVAMPPEPLAQVVSNLLVNCARYAPGAPVRVRAWEEDGVGRIEVADSGPGIGGAPAPDGLQSGSGIGLAVSSRLLAEHGGSLRLLPDQPGWTVLVEIPLASFASQVPAARRGALIPGAA